MNKWILTIKNHSHEIDGDTGFNTLENLERFIERSNIQRNQITKVTRTSTPSGDKTFKVTSFITVRSLKIILEKI